jgi:heavy metal sensor kinase
MKWGSVRLRLTMWYLGAMVVVLAIYAGCLLWFVNQGASRSLDNRLRGDFRWAVEMAEQRPDGSLAWFEGSTGDDEDSPWLQVWSPEGELLFRTAVAGRQPIPESGALAARADNRIVSVPTATVPIRVLSGHSKVGGKGVVLQVARSEAGMRRTMHDLIVTLLLSLPLAVAAAGLGGYSLARRALAPVDRIAERARSITAERLSERLPVDNRDDELGRLALVINDMLGRLESSFGQMRRFTADVSHELRTPLTAIRSVGEVGLRERRDEQAYRATIGSMLEEVDRLSYLVDRLLTLSRAEAGLVKPSVDVVDLRELAEDVVMQLGVLAEEKRQLLTLEADGRGRAVGDRVVLRQALINLVHNAIKYTPEGGRIRVRISESPSGPAVDVIDTGPGVAPNAASRIFDRFDRGDRSRPEDGGGAGLGLAIAKWAVEVSGGRLTLETPSGTNPNFGSVPAVGAGATFRIALPGDKK